MIKTRRILTMSGLRMLDSSCSVMGPLKDLNNRIPMDCGGGGGEGGINPNRVLTISGLSILDSSCSVMGPLKDLDNCMPMDCVCVCVGGGGRGV